MFLKQGSRGSPRTSFKWGIPVDFDRGMLPTCGWTHCREHVTGIGYDADGSSSDLHLISDIIRFHTIYWPIFLMSRPSFQNGLRASLASAEAAAR